MVSKDPVWNAILTNRVLDVWHKWFVLRPVLNVNDVTLSVKGNHDTFESTINDWLIGIAFIHKEMTSEAEFIHAQLWRFPLLEDVALFIVLSWGNVFKLYELFASSPEYQKMISLDKLEVRVMTIKSTKLIQSQGEEICICDSTCKTFSTRTRLAFMQSFICYLFTLHYYNVASTTWW